MHESPVSQLLSSLFLVSICLIPNHTIRLAALAVSLVMALVYIIYAKYSPTELAQLEGIIEKTEQVVQDAGAHCCIGPFILVEVNLRLLEVKRSASLIRCHILESRTSIWKKYYRLSRDISSCTQVISKVLIAVQTSSANTLQISGQRGLHTRDGHRPHGQFSIRTVSPPHTPEQLRLSPE
ncbi:hypothetical protein GGX14DRAFT_392732 [Mycena pura]|uniref:Uncharacterized protein n=1 Tax=Mycena pura TaxID=153505 RepID=A0AAD6VIG9_9AGAR|nr:hypothetical protein GGX14DRAFT_392732 [Mycena pura]